MKSPVQKPPKSEALDFFVDTSVCVLTFLAIICVL